ncbi:MAG: methylmalonyl Co-A mutase-associated GTPase MeaB [Candidatus Heimdallarchaeota archaeon]|nr:methylmalonyl Co-A mutase-associated GTPase MeaB [Candidatus Heimdallarchaeota archaeon]MDH5645533.1 methylmalonyl Co-A mutase-associated GTPase MeaB [Candidatus Heimdallarchaeota archaeon]
MESSAILSLQSEYFNHNIRALSRAITLAEVESDHIRSLLETISKNRNNTHIIGVTGSPGSGKSTLVDKLIESYRAMNYRVAVIAIDPSSPFSGGALLGDRIRMLRFSTDPEVYIRSLASRGSLGGLSPAVFDVLTLIDGFGFDKIIIETVGIGQSEVDIMNTCHSTVLVLVSTLGDDIQINKAGIMEIADLFVINKTDITNPEHLQLYVEEMLSLKHEKKAIVKTNSLIGEGIDDLILQLNQHWEEINSPMILDQFKRKQIIFELTRRINQKITTLLSKNGLPNPLNEMVVKILTGGLTMRDATDTLIQALNQVE